MTKTMTTRMLYGKDLSEYEHMDVDELLTHLSPEELEILSKDVDPDVKDDSLLVPNSLRKIFMNELIKFLGHAFTTRSANELCLW